jgi:hypothetical protein
MERVAGRCPRGCGETLFLGSGGYVTCSHLGCPDPEAATRLLEQTNLLVDRLTEVDRLAGCSARTVIAMEAAWPPGALVPWHIAYRAAQVRATDTSDLVPFLEGVLGVIGADHTALQHINDHLTGEGESMCGGCLAEGRTREQARRCAAEAS